MRVGNKRFIDSYLFIPIPLANFTKTFGLKELRKGFFPHYLTSPEALAEPASALHSPCDCKATNGCHLQYQFSQVAITARRNAGKRNQHCQAKQGRQLLVSYLVSFHLLVCLA